MIADNIRDTMEEVRSVLDEMDEGSVEWELMSVAHSELAMASRIVFEVNRLRLAELLKVED